MTPCLTTSWPGSVRAQLPPCSAARSTITEPGRMRLHHFVGDEDGSLLAGNESGRDDDVRAGDDLRHQLLLFAVELLGLGLGVAGLVLGVLGLQAQLDELAAEAFHLLLDGGPRVVRLDDRASRRAVPMACNPATPAPMTNTRRASPCRPRS